MVDENLSEGEGSAGRPKESERQRELREIKERRQRGEVYERPHLNHITAQEEAKDDKPKDYGVWGEGGDGLIRCEFLTAGEKYGEDTEEYLNVYRQLDRVVPFGGARSLTLKERMEGLERLVKSKMNKTLRECYIEEKKMEGKSITRQIVENFNLKAGKGKLDVDDVEAVCLAFKTTPRELYDAGAITTREQLHSTLYEMSQHINRRETTAGDRIFMDRFQWWEHPGIYHYDGKDLGKYVFTRTGKHAEDLVKTNEERKIVKTVLKSRSANSETLKWFCDRVGLAPTDLETQKIFDKCENLPIEGSRDKKGIWREGFRKIADCVKNKGIFVSRQFPDGESRLYYLTRDVDSACEFSEALKHHKVDFTSYSHGDMNVVRCNKPLQSRRVYSLMQRAYGYHLRESKFSHTPAPEAEFVNLKLHDVTDVLPLVNDELESKSIKEGETVPINRLGMSDLISVFINQEEGNIALSKRLVDEFGYGCPRPMYLHKRNSRIYSVYGFGFEEINDVAGMGDAPVIGKGIYREPEVSLSSRLSGIKDKIFRRKVEAAGSDRRREEAAEDAANLKVEIDEAEVKSGADVAVEKFYEKNPAAREAVQMNLEKREEDEEKLEVNRQANQLFDEVKKEKGRMSLDDCGKLVEFCGQQGFDLNMVKRGLSYQKNVESLSFMKKNRSALERLTVKAHRVEEDADVKRKADMIMQNVKDAHGSMTMLEVLILAKTCRREGIDVQEIDGQASYYDNKVKLREHFMVTKKTFEVSELDTVRMQNEWLAEENAQKENELTALKSRNKPYENTEKVEKESPNYFKMVQENLERSYDSAETPKERKKISTEKEVKHRTEEKQVQAEAVNFSKANNAKVKGAIESKYASRMIPYNALVKNPLRFGDGIITVKGDGVYVSKRIIEISNKEISKLYGDMQNWVLDGKTFLPDSPEKMTDESFTKFNVMLQAFIGEGNFSVADMGKPVNLTPEQVKEMIVDEKLRMKVEKKGNDPLHDRLGHIREGDAFEDAYLQFFSYAFHVEVDGGKVKVSTRVYRPEHLEVVRELLEGKSYSFEVKPVEQQNNYGGNNYFNVATVLMDSSYSLFRDKPQRIDDRMSDECFSAGLCGFIDAKGYVKAIVRNDKVVPEVSVKSEHSFLLNQIAIRLDKQMDVKSKVLSEGYAYRLIVDGADAEKLCSKLTGLRNIQNVKWRDRILSKDLSKESVITINREYSEGIESYLADVKYRYEALQRGETSIEPRREDKLH